MKRITALFLAIVMVFLMFPVSTLTNATAITEKPFFCVNMSGSGGDNPNTYQMPFFYSYDVDENTVWPQVSCYGTHYEGELAQKLKEDFNNRPKGSRYFQLCLLHDAFFGQVEDAIYFDKAVETVRMWLTDFLTEYKKIGGELDGIIVDLEYLDNNAWYIQDIYRSPSNKNYNPNIYKDIVADPRYAAEVKPRLKELGFDFQYEGTAETELISVSYYVDTTLNPKYIAANAGIWNAVVDAMEVQAINDAVLYPMQNFYPDATVSDYQSGTYDPWEKAIGEHGAAEAGSFGTVGAGNLSNQNSYNGRPSQAFVDALSTPPGYNNAIFAVSPFATAQYDVNLFKNMYASTDDGQIDAWIAHYWYNAQTSGYASGYSETPYYTENIYHIGMLDPKPFLGYLIESEIIGVGHTLNEAMGIVSDIMLELTRVVGTSDRKPIVIPQTQAYWNAGYILSGMYSGGRNVWRLTPDTTKVSLEDFKIKNKAPTFSVDGVTITFPQGRIIADGDISIAGSCGYWIETPADVVPVITAVDDRYTQYPALLETFDSYDADFAFTTDTALPKKAWNVEASSVLSSGTATVRANGTNNKALALNGSVVVDSLVLPSKVTAGDDYAKQQVWEATVTLPSSLRSTAAIKLLYATDNDAGFRISNNEVSYGSGTSGSYTTMSNITLSAGGTYTFRREMDFRTTGSFKCTYTVLDANGNVLGTAADVTIPNIALPTASISFSTSIANNEVLIDNYKLYVQGVNTFLELYDAKIGAKATLGTARTTDTAYRMSWLNATNEPAVAEIYDTATGKVYKTIEMGANMDGYVTGVVSASSSSPVTLAVRTVAGTETTPPDYDNGDFGWPTFEENMSRMGKAHIKIPSVNENGENINIDIVLDEGETVYLLTNEDGKAVYTGASADNYNIKFTYPENGTPTLYLKNAKLTNGQWHALDIGKAATASDAEIKDFSLIIHVEEDSVIEGTDNVEGQSGTYSAISYNANAGYTLTITGPGKLTATSEGQWAIRSGNEVFIKYTTFVGKALIPSNQGMRAPIFVNNNVTIDHSVVDLYTTSGPVINLGNDISALTANTYNKLTIRNGAAVTIANPDSGSYLPAVMLGGDFTIDRSSVEIISKFKCFTFGPKMILIDSAVAGSSAETATTYNPANASSYTYFKADVHTPVVDAAVRATCTQPGLTEGSHCSKCGEVIVAQTVIPAAGHTAAGPVIENVVVATAEHDGSYHKVTDCVICGIEMNREIITIPATDTVKTITVKLPITDNSGNDSSTTVSVSEGGATKYLLTNPVTGKVSSSGANASNYNIKVEYPLNGEPIVYLRSANIIGSVWHALTISTTATDVFTTICVKEDSTVAGRNNTVQTSGSYSAIVGDNLIITGPGKLTATSQDFYTITSGKNVIFKDANVSATCNANSGSFPAIRSTGGNIIIDNSIVEATSVSGYGMMISTQVDSLVGDPYDIIIRNGSNVKVQGAYIYRPVLGCTGNLIISDSAVEVQGTAKALGNMPVMSGVTPYGGSSPEYFQLFNEKKIDIYNYFKTVPCAHTGGTATCEEKAVCSICGYYYGDFGHIAEEDDGDCTTAVKCTLCGDTVVHANADHNPGVIASCTTAQTCTTCGMVVKSATGHSYVIQEAVEATCDTSGLTEGKSCSVCGVVFSVQEIVYPKGHTAVKDAAVAPDCLNTGLTEGSHCSVCNKVLTAQTVVPATGHTTGVAEYVEIVGVTCTTDGTYKLAESCLVCGEDLESTTITIPAADHLAADPVIENRVVATADAAGSYDSVVYCASCGELISRTTVTVPMLGTKSAYVGIAQSASAGFAWTITNNGVAQYACTVNGYASAVDANGKAAGEDNYNIKFVWPADSDEAILYLKNANIDSTNTSDAYYGLTIGGGQNAVKDFNLKIVVEDASSIQHETMPALQLNCTKTTITGDALLTLSNVGSQYCIAGTGELYLKDANVFAHGQTSSGNYPVVYLQNNLTVDGGIFLARNSGSGIGINLTGSPSYYQASSALTNNLTIKNGAKVTIEAKNYTRQTIALGGTFTIENSDVTVYGKNTIFVNGRYPVLSFDGEYTAVASKVALNASGEPNDSDLIAYTGAQASYKYFNVTHSCVAATPVKVQSEGVCNQYASLVTYCATCGKELSRMQIKQADASDVPHTPGEPAENTELYVPATSTANGSRTIQVHCTVCGELLSSTTIIIPKIRVASFTYLTMGGRTDSGATKTVDMLPGDATLYFTTAASDANNPDRTYLVSGANESNYNVKIAYPEGGVPTVYLRGANLYNDDGIIFGSSTYNDTPLNIVVETDSYIRAGTDYVYGALNLNTSADVTISSVNGAQLELVSTKYNAPAATLVSKGNINIVNANLLFTFDSVWPSTSGIYTTGGNVVIDSSKLDIWGSYVAKNEDGTTSGTNNDVVTGIIAKANANGVGGQLIIRNGSDVQVLVDQSAVAISTEKGAVISDSDVIFGTAWGSGYILDNSLDLVFTDRYYAVASTTSTGIASYENHLLRVPSDCVEFVSADATTYRYFQVESMHEHGYEAVVTAPTCTEDGYTTYTCSCGHSYVDNVVKTTGHNKIDAVRENEVEATCTTPGSYEIVEICSVCGKLEETRRTVELPALNHSNAYVDNGDGTHDYTCDVCSTVVIDDEAHEYVDGSCVCGAEDPEVEKPVINGVHRDRTLLTKGSIYIKATIAFMDEERAANAEGLTDEYVLENGGILFWRESEFPANVDEAIMGSETSKSALYDAGYYQGIKEFYGESFGIAAKEYNDTIYYRTYILVDGEYVYGDIIEYGVARYCVTQIPKTSATYVALRPLLVAMLKYGSAAQLHFGYKTDSLAVSNLTQFVGVVLTEDDLNMELDMAWDDPLLTAPEGASAEMAVNFPTNTTTKRTDRTLLLVGSIEAKLTFAYNIVSDKGTELPADGKITAYFWNGTDYAALAEAGTVLNIDNASYTISATAAEIATGEAPITLAYSSRYGYEYQLNTEGFAAKDLGNALYYAFVFEMGDGTEYRSGIDVYNPEMYAATQLKKATSATITENLKTLLRWMTQYGEVAYQYYKDR